MIRLFRVSIPSSALALVISETILVFSCYILAGYVTLDLASDIFLWEDGGWWRVALVALFILLGLYFNDLYDTYPHPVSHRPASSSFVWSWAWPFCYRRCLATAVGT